MDLALTLDLDPSLTCMNLCHMPSIIGWAFSLTLPLLPPRRWSPLPANSLNQEYQLSTACAIHPYLTEVFTNLPAPPIRPRSYALDCLD